MSRSDDWVFKNLRKAIKAREKADADKRKATEDLKRALQEARMMETPITHLANETGLSRQAIYDLLAK